MAEHDHTREVGLTLLAAAQYERGLTDEKIIFIDYAHIVNYKLLPR
jgi:hypothetical protein